jgi:hypothetical protein
MVEIGKEHVFEGSDGQATRAQQQSPDGLAWPSRQLRYVTRQGAGRARRAARNAAGRASSGYLWMACV